MKIAVIDNLPEGGAKRVVWEQLYFLNQKHQLLYCTNTISSKFTKNLPIIISKLPFNPPISKGWSRPLQDIRLLLHTYEWYKKQKGVILQWRPDIIIAHPCMVTQAPLILLLQKSIPVIYFMEETYRVFYEKHLQPQHLSFFKHLYQSLYRFIIHLIDLRATTAATSRITTSSYVQQQVKRWYGLSSKLIWLGVNTEQFKPSTSQPAKYFVFVGEKVEVNGFDLLSQALSLAKAPINVIYITFNNKKLKYSDSDLTQIYQNSYAVLCLSKQEPFGLTALEGMASGVPVIALKEGGYIDTVTEETGILIDRDPSKLLQSLLLLMKSEKIRKKLGKNGCNRVTEHFTWLKHGQELEKIIFKLIKN